MGLSNPFLTSALAVDSVSIDPANFRLLVKPPAPSPVLQWNQLLADLIAANKIGPTRASRAFALLNSGFYDLWASSDAAAEPVYAPADATLAPAELEAALQQFAAGLLAAWFPANASLINQQWQGQAPQSTTASIPASPALTGAVQRQLQAMPALDPWKTGSPPAAPVSTRAIAVWQPEHVPIDNPNAPLQSYLTPAWGTLPAFATSDVSAWRPPGPEPFLLVSSDWATVDLASATLVLLRDWAIPGGQLRPAGRYDIRDPLNQQWMVGEVINPAFVQQAQQVVDLQRDLSDEQKLIAEFWESGPGTAFPPGQWMAITALLAERQPLSLSEQIKLFFSVGQGVGDAGIAAWDAKAAFNYARPVRVIRDLASLNLLSGDDLLHWDTYQNPSGPSSPPFPEYVSGHSTFSGAAAEVLRSYFGSDTLDLNISFPAGSSRFESGTTPSQLTTLAWETLTDAAASAGLSRLYGGIHFADGNLDGLALGHTVGDAVLSRAASLAYADLTTVLAEPFLLRNTLQLQLGHPPQLDGEELPAQLMEINLAGGDDVVNMANGASFAGRLFGGAGQDRISYADFSNPVRVDLSQMQATGLAQLVGFEQVDGGSSDDTLIGDAENNRFHGGGSNDLIDGGPGEDTASYNGKRSDFRFERDRVIDLRSSADANQEGSDVIRGIEQLSFADGTWPVTDLFTPIGINLSLLAPTDPLVVREGQAVDVQIRRQGDLMDPIEIQLNWQPQPEDRLTNADLERGGTALKATLLPGQSITRLSLPLTNDALFEGTEVGHLALSSAQLLGAAHLPVAPNLNLDRTPVELVVLDNDPQPDPTAFQRLNSSPLPLRVVPGGVLRIPLTYSVSDQNKDLSGLSFQVQVPPSLKWLGFTPTSQATQAASLWAAVEQPTTPAPEGSNTAQLSSVRISFASEAAAWPGQQGPHLPLPIGDLRFGVAPGFSATDALTGLSLTASDTAMGYGFESKAPTLQLAKGWSLDVDGDGVVRPLSDGLMVLRYLMGFQGSALTQKAMSPMGSRSTSASVAAWIERGRQESWLDFDGDGRTTALGDGLMLMRAMFGMQGDSLLSKAIAPQSPLLDGHRYDQLTPDEKLWVGQQVLDRIQALSI